jgi:hypothetical protein
VTSVLGQIAQVISGAEHSTTWGWEYNSCTGGWTTNVVACNHGNCANSSGLSYSCYSGSGAAGPNPPTVYLSSSSILNYWAHETTTSNTTTTGACGTGYGIDILDVTIFGNGDANHVCNDDSAMELDEIRNIRNDSSSWSGGTGGWNGSFSCNHWTHWYGPLNTDAEAPNCP